MEKPDIFHPIPVILNGSNYSHWVNAMWGFLKGRKLWRYVTVKDVVTENDKATDGTSKGDADKNFVEKLED
ncbi:hypothetical protein PIB30_050014 [Stylosanthes scabra]|uniref:Retrotransposon Copia-like N-terminal domain-containing protein n=1 Tax=Stylosanthes scabra TaxID=79078 RepID=A0ABU6UHU2_9FABA|nr:hypothetical protein [Stylosanthes scabra]